MTPLMTQLRNFIVCSHVKLKIPVVAKPKNEINNALTKKS